MQAEHRDSSITQLHCSSHHAWVVWWTFTDTAVKQNCRHLRYIRSTTSMGCIWCRQNGVISNKGLVRF